MMMKTMKKRKFNQRRKTSRNKELVFLQKYMELTTKREIT
jgi:hypothetical protein